MYSRLPHVQLYVMFSIHKGTSNANYIIGVDRSIGREDQNAESQMFHNVQLQILISHIASQ